MLKLALLGLALLSTIVAVANGFPAWRVGSAVPTLRTLSTALCLASTLGSLLKLRWLRLLLP